MDGKKFFNKDIIFQNELYADKKFKINQKEEILINSKNNLDYIDSSFLSQNNKNFSTGLIIFFISFMAAVIILIL